MKRSVYERSWGEVMLAALMVVVGFLYEPLLAVLGAIIIVCSAVVSIAESKRRNFEEISHGRTYDEIQEDERKISYIPHKAV